MLLNGCAESVALLGSSVGGVSNGKIIQSSLNSAISYGVKQQTGKSPLEHAIAYAEEKNPQKKKEPCLSFLEKTNSEICAIVKALEQPVPNAHRHQNRNENRRYHGNQHVRGNQIQHGVKTLLPRLRHECVTRRYIL